MKLKIEDFKKIEAGVGFPPYFQHITRDQREVCLEPCLYGFCIGVYDKDRELIGKKGCTNFGNDMEITMEGTFKFGDEVDARAVEEAVDIANKMLSEEKI